MKKVLTTLLSAGLISSSFAITKDEAVKKIKSYASNLSGASSKIAVCENDKYYIGEIFTKGYEGFDVLRKVYVDKKTGDILPSFADYSDYCYMLKK
ncbi:MAG: hypothetical protein D6831_00040 [Aquificota bacterium]|nr:MAG: hypothetical protein D6831_00040 [Aquificota bacterium]